MFFEVLAKCGHVGRNNYIVKKFYVKAESGKEAARIIRLAPRVKHHQKDAIIEVHKIDYEQYVQGAIRMNEDPYFNVYNTSDQKRFNLDDIIREDIYEEERVRQVQFKLKKWKLIERESKRMALGVYYG